MGLLDRICDGCCGASETASALALACRDDLDSLPVLADWCDGNGLPASAAELRHLYGHVRCIS